MSDLEILLILYAIGVLVLIAEVFIPSHGVLCVIGTSCIIAAVVKTFAYGGRDAGMISVLACLTVLPTMGYFAVKYWPHTPIGRRIAPPNPVLTLADTSVPIEELRAMIGQSGVAVSSLRPVGICEFNGQRVSCVAEVGIVESGTEVVGTGITSGNLAVRVKMA